VSHPVSWSDVHVMKIKLEATIDLSLLLSSRLFPLTAWAA